MGWLVAERHGPQIAASSEVGGDVCWMWDGAMLVSSVVVYGCVGVWDVVDLAWDVVFWLDGGG